MINRELVKELEKICNEIENEKNLTGGQPWQK